MKLSRFKSAKTRVAKRLKDSPHLNTDSKEVVESLRIIKKSASRQTYLLHRILGILSKEPINKDESNIQKVLE